MKKVLINFAHPVRSRSKINNAMRAAIEDLEGVTVNDLYACYPDFLIDIKREQKLCEEHDAIIFQHPFYWHSTPAIMKEWLDLVLEHGWAYGSKAQGLKGKLFLQALSAGGTYRQQQGRDGGFTIAELTSPYRSMAKLCNLVWLPPFTLLGIHHGLPDEDIRGRAEEYRRAVVALRDETIDLEKVAQYPYLNSDLNAVIGGA
jgi:glutathione-regulated potassium-efflux system ancillary protein KefG